MQRIWPGPRFFVTHLGDTERALSHDRRARIYAGYLFDALGETTTRFQQWVEADGTTIWVQVWRDVTGEHAVAKIDSPPRGGKPITPIGGRVAFIPNTGYIANPLTGQRMAEPHYTFASPYLDDSGNDIEGLLGTRYGTSMIGREGDLRMGRINECGWLASRNPETGEWTATRGHAGYFGCQNWLGQDGEDGRADVDIVSWDGPKSRYSGGGMLGYTTQGGRVFHKLRILCDLKPLAQANGWDVKCTIGAAIQHDGEHIWLHQITRTSNDNLNAFRWELFRTDTEAGDGEFTARYTASVLPEFMHDSSPREHFVAEDNSAIFRYKSGFYFNAAGTEAVCTIGSDPGSGGSEFNLYGTQRTYLYTYSPEQGFNRNMVYDADAITVKEEGRLEYPPDTAGNEFVTHIILCYPTHTGAAHTCVDGFTNHVVWTPSKEYIYRTLPNTQVLYADYKGNQLVYLYYTNPTGTHTYTVSENGSAWFQYEDCPGVPGLYDPWPCNGKISGRVTKWTVRSEMNMQVSERRYHSSDGIIDWSGGACESSIIMSGNEQHLDEGLPAAYPNVRDPPNVTAPYDMLFTHHWNGWTYTKPARCRAQKKLYNVGFVDLRFGVMALTEEAWQEVANPMWRWDFFAGDQQYYELTIDKTVRLIDGSTVVRTVTLPRVYEPELPIGVPINKYGQWSGSGMGLDYWYRMVSFYIALPSSIEQVGSELFQDWGYTSKSWHSMETQSASPDGICQMLKCGGDLIYNYIYRGTVYDFNGANPGVDDVDPIRQVTSWAGDPAPQVTFFDGSMTTHMLGNIGLV